MAAFADWLDRLLTEGESVMDGPPDVSTAESVSARQILGSAYKLHALDVAGPPLPFNEATALAAAELLAAACWRLVSDDDSPSPRPKLAREPRTAAAHLSADLTLRFLPAVYQRARLRGSDDPLAAELADRLRHWPLSGVLADLRDPPATAPDFGGHPGLALLYAERLIEHEKPEWLPATGLVREQAERVYAERDRPLPVSVPAEETVA